MTLGLSGALKSGRSCLTSYFGYSHRSIISADFANGETVVRFVQLGGISPKMMYATGKGISTRPSRFPSTSYVLLPVSKLPVQLLTAKSIRGGLVGNRRVMQGDRSSPS